MCALLDSIAKEIVSVVSRITDLVGLTASTRSVVLLLLKRALGILFCMVEILRYHSLYALSGAVSLLIPCCSLCTLLTMMRSMVCQQMRVSVLCSLSGRGCCKRRCTYYGQGRPCCRRTSVISERYVYVLYRNSRHTGREPQGRCTAVTLYLHACLIVKSLVTISRSRRRRAASCLGKVLSARRWGSLTMIAGICNEHRHHELFSNLDVRLSCMHTTLPEDTETVIFKPF